MLVRRAVLKRRVPTTAIVLAFERIEQGRARLLTRGPLGVGDQRLLERGEEALGHGVVLAVPLAAYAGDGSVVGQALPVERGGVCVP